MSGSSGRPDNANRASALARFRRMKTLRNFSPVHAQVHNHLASRPFG